MKKLLMKFQYVIKLFLLQLFCSSIIFALFEILKIFPSNYGYSLYHTTWDFIRNIPNLLAGIFMVFGLLFLTNIVSYFYRIKIVFFFINRELNNFYIIFLFFSFNTFFYFFLISVLFKYPMWVEMIKIIVSMFFSSIFLHLRSCE